MRSALVISALIVCSACSFERSVAPPPQPQKSALRGCYVDHNHRPTTQPCTQPLLIIDGQPASWDGPDDMNPSDIYSVEIAKGDSAVVRFGKEARKGVVVITTKHAFARKGLEPKT